MRAPCLVTPPRRQATEFVAATLPDCDRRITPEHVSQSVHEAAPLRVLLSQLTLDDTGCDDLDIVEIVAYRIPVALSAKLPEAFDQSICGFLKSIIGGPARLRDC